MKIDVYSPFRPCAFCLRLQGGCVFADFDLDGSGRAILVRISYDGYGCCQADLRAESRCLSQHDTGILLAAMASGQLQTAAVAEILRTYFSRNQDALWPDALAAHGLIDDVPG
jgi:hypothetical protein